MLLPLAAGFYLRYPLLHPALWFTASLAICGYFLFRSVYSVNKNPLDKTGFFISIALISGGLSLTYQWAAYLDIPLAVGTASFFGVQVFVPVWAAIAALGARDIILHRPGAVPLVLFSVGSGAVSHFALRRFKALASGLAEKVSRLDEENSEPGLSTGDLDVLGAAEKEFSQALLLARELLEADSVSVFRVAGDDIAVKSSTSTGIKLRSEGIIRLCLKNRQPVCLSKMDREELFSPGYEHGQPVCSLMAAPLVLGSTVLGVAACDSRRTGAFSLRHLSDFQRFSAFFAGMMGRERVFTEMKRNLKGLEVFKDESSKILKHLSKGDIAREGARAARKIAPMPAAIFLRSKDGYELSAATGFSGDFSDDFLGRGPAGQEKKTKTFFKSLKGTLMANAFAGGQEPIYISDCRDFPVAALPFDGGFQVKSVLLQPLSGEEGVLGVLGMFSDRTNSLSAHQIELIKMFSNQLAVSFCRALLHEKLAVLAETDALTGLFNRGYYEEALSREFKRLVRHPRPLSLLLIDIDHFKKINDTFGHTAGDAVLKKVAAIIKNVMRDTDVAARYGGEEFVAILAETDKAGAQNLAERLRKAVFLNPIDAGGNTVTVSVSIGVASFPRDTSSRDGLVELADKALYSAKSEGRNRVCLAKQAD
ncbi:MAG: diguanylate cyclase [Nitrospiraceae bacterium]|nr:diguanylate cyclase [Nitrospiraceae bacterium]